jgi:two-component system, NtrC family, sensor kinase
MMVIQSAMFNGQTSIQNKVRYGYYICIAMIIFIALLNYFNLQAIDKKLTFSFIISDFFEATLEMRRFEKNYFLYRDHADYEENLKYTERAEALIHHNREAIRNLSPDTDVKRIEALIADYKRIIKEYHDRQNSLAPISRMTFEANIRETGKKIVEATEGISIAERSYVISTISSSKKIIFVTVVIVLILGVLIGRYFSRVVVRPLKDLEDSMQRIADGRFDTMEITSHDTEIISLGHACRRMIAEIELRQKKFMMQSERLVSLGTMISGVAHELNNPLSNVFSSCQILQEEIGEGELEYKKLLLQQIHDEIERARTMVQTLLDFSRKTEFKRKPYSLRYIVDEAIRLIHGELPAKVSVSASIPEGIWIVANKQRIEQVILNLIKNAVDAIADEGSVTISAREFRAEGVVKLGICDTGIGIDQDKVSTIFDPFYTTKEDGKGSGLGLFITRQIIEDHEGTIMVESVSGEGSTFTITLPFKEV